MGLMHCEQLLVTILCPVVKKNHPVASWAEFLFNNSKQPLLIQKSNVVIVTRYVILTVCNPT
jgi:hypothetical protein